MPITISHDLSARQRCELQLRPVLTLAETLATDQDAQQLPAVLLARQHVCLGERAIRLTRTEYNLLRELATPANPVLLHGRLLVAVWGAEYRDDLDY